MAITDPRWLYTVLAESAAALVAIVGGLMISRLVNVLSERDRLQQRQRVVTYRRDQAQKNADELEPALAKGAGQEQDDEPS